jgi:hypothetical protein
MRRRSRQADASSSRASTTRAGSSRATGPERLAASRPIADLQDTLANTPAGKRASEAFDRTRKAKQGLLDKQQEEIRKESTELDKQKATLKPEVFEVTEHVDERVAHLTWRGQLAAVPALRPHLASATKRVVEALGERDREAAHARTEHVVRVGLPADSLDDEMYVILLNGELHDLERGRVATVRSALTVERSAEHLVDGLRAGAFVTATISSWTGVDAAVSGANIVVGRAIEPPPYRAGTRARRRFRFGQL